MGSENLKIHVRQARQPILVHSVIGLTTLSWNMSLVELDAFLVVLFALVALLVALVVLLVELCALLVVLVAPVVLVVLFWLC